MTQRKVQTLESDLLYSSKKLKDYEYKILRYEKGINRLQTQANSLIEQLHQ